MRLFYPTSVTLSRNIVKSLRRAAFPCYPLAMHRLGPAAAAVLIAALDASWAAAAECTCRAPGRQVELGQTACLMTPKGPRLATCGMALNNTSWQFSQTPCTLSDVSPPGPLRVAQARRLDVARQDYEVHYGESER
jgi:hypothetical protein